MSWLIKSIGTAAFLCLALGVGAQGLAEPPQRRLKSNYLLALDDARLDIGIRLSSIFALDDRAPLASNPHFQAMWNLIRLGATIEALSQGHDEPQTELNLAETFGQNGYNKTVFSLFIRYGFGETSDLKIQRHFLELAVGPGYFKEGNGGTNIHLDYQLNVLKTPYGAGGQSLQRDFEYEIFLGGRVGYDGTARRSESEAGFFSFLSNEIRRLADENELTAAQLIQLQDLAETSRVLLPEDVGGRAFHAGLIGGGRLSKKFMKNAEVFLTGMGFYDLLDLGASNRGKGNQRSQHHASLSLGARFTIGAEGEMMEMKFF